MLSLDRKILKGLGLSANDTNFCLSLFASVLTLLLILCAAISAISTLFVQDQSNITYNSNSFLHISFGEPSIEGARADDRQQIMNSSTMEEINKLNSTDDISIIESKANPDNPDYTFDKDSIGRKTLFENPREPVEKIITDYTFNDTNIVNPGKNKTDLLNCKTPFCDLMNPENISGKITIRPISLCTPTFASPEVFAASDYSFVKQWGSKGKADGEFNGPFGIAHSSSGDVIVTDVWNHRIQKFTADGVFISKWSLPVGTLRQFSPIRMAVDGCNIYVLDYRQELNLVYKFDSNLSPVEKWAPRPVHSPSYPYPLTDPAHIVEPRGIGIDRSSGAVYIVDTDLPSILKFSGDGKFILKWGQFGRTADGDFDSPYDVAVDSSGNVYVVDSLRENIQKFTSNGNFIDKWGTHGNDKGQFNHPSSIATDAADNVYVGEYYNKRIQKFSSDGAFITSIPVSGRVVDMSVDESSGKIYATIYDDHVEVYAPNLDSHKDPIVPEILGPPN
jgi:hypothetical protein